VPFTLGFPERVTKYKTHRSEFGTISEAEYAERADALWGQPPGPPLLECTRTRDRSRVRYNEATEELGLLSAAGYILTHFRPDPFEHTFPTNREYFFWICRGG
jgi:hypothetical protein